MNITIICVPYQVDVARWGCANGPQAFLDHGLISLLEAGGHTISAPTWIELPKAERTRDSVTNLGRIAQRTAAAVRAALQEDDSFALVLEGDCTHAVGAIGGLAQARRNTGVVWFDAHGDLNTVETSTSGFLGGLPYAVALGWDLDDWRLAAGLEPPVRPQAAALIGAGIGGIGGGLLGGLIGAGVSKERARVYEATLYTGGILLAVHADGEGISRVRQILEADGAVNVQG